jgi:hypothetical protein
MDYLKLFLPLVLFVVLSPGMFLTIPGSSTDSDESEYYVEFMSGETSVVAVLVHGVVYLGLLHIILYVLRKSE